MAPTRVEDSIAQMKNTISWEQMEFNVPLNKFVHGTNFVLFLIDKFSAEILN